MASFASASTITQLLSPSDASKFSGRYESVVKKKNGDEVKVLRSLRHAPNQNLLIRANITPQKVTSNDVDDLCDLFKTSVSVSPKKTPTKRSAKKDKSVAAADTTVKKTNVVSSPVNKRRGTASATKKTLLFKDKE